MTLSIDDFKTATAYPCGDRKECRAFLKEVPELNNVKMPAAVRDTLTEGSKATFKTNGKVSVR